MDTLDDIYTFFDKQKSIAVAGVSQNPKKFGRIVYDDLKKKGYKLIPINPHSNKIGDDECIKSITELSKDVDRLIIITPKNKTDVLLYEASLKEIKYVWIQQMSQTKESITIAKQLNLNVIINQCVFMFAEPVQGIHKFHKGIKRLFGGLPKYN